MKRPLTMYLILGIIIIVGISITKANGKNTSSNLSNSNNTTSTLNKNNITSDDFELLNIECNGKQTITLSEGPYYKPGSPQRISLLGDDLRSNSNINELIFILSGYVLNTECKPIQNAWLDFWQTDSNGHYDNQGFKYRGHQYTDANGAYSLVTSKPLAYSGRAPHIHVKLRATEKSSIITTQLFLPDNNQNKSDTIFDNSLIINLNQKNNIWLGTYNFVLAHNL